MKAKLLIIFALSLMACQHVPWTPQGTESKPSALNDRADTNCMAFLADLEAMSIKELKGENDRWQKASAEKKSEDDLRLALISGIYQAKIRNYERAFDILSPLSNRKNLDESCKASVHLFTDLLEDTLSFERDLASEKKQKVELERKLKALSQIEKDISRRDSKGHGL